MNLWECCKKLFDMYTSIGSVQFRVCLKNEEFGKVNDVTELTKPLCFLFNFEIFDA